MLVTSLLLLLLFFFFFNIYNNIYHNIFMSFQKDKGFFDKGLIFRL